MCQSHQSCGLPSLSSPLGSTHSTLKFCRQYFASFGDGKDILEHRTVSHNSVGTPWASSPDDMVPLVQYRMSLNDVGRSLTTFKSSHQLVQSVADAMDAHDQAFSKARILHRDISVGNILITHEGRGLLVDWDLCLNLEKQNVPKRRLNRNGTWQFLSIKLLQGSSSPHRIADDRESALWVLLWIVLQFCKHKDSASLAMFNELRQTGEQDSGGINKLGFILRQNISEMGFSSEPLTGLLDELQEVLDVRYWRKKPSSKDFEIVKQFAATYPEAVQKLQPAAYVYKTHSENLVRKGWMVEIFEKHLSVDGWPVDDKASHNPITSQGTGRKRTQQDANLAERVASNKRSV